MHRMANEYNRLAKKFTIDSMMKSRSNNKPDSPTWKILKDSKNALQLKYNINPEQMRKSAFLIKGPLS